MARSQNEKGRREVCVCGWGGGGRLNRTKATFSMRKHGLYFHCFWNAENFLNSKRIFSQQSTLFAKKISP